MSSVEAVFCRSAPWRGFARRVVLPWVLDEGERLGPDVLEIGGGSGAMAQELLDRHPDIRLTLADIDPAMAAAARRRLAPFGDRAQVTVGDGTRLDFPDDSFDTVCSWLMLHHTIDWEGVLAEVARVTRPGGLIVGYDLTDTAIARVVHRLEGSEYRLLRPAELERELGRLGTAGRWSSARWAARRCGSARGRRERLHAHRARRRAREEAPPRADWTRRWPSCAGPARSWRTRRPPTRSAASSCAASTRCSRWWRGWSSRGPAYAPAWTSAATAPPRRSRGGCGRTLVHQQPGESPYDALARELGV